MAKKVTGKNYYALLCYSSADGNICGVYASRKEAKEVAQETRECMARHKIVRCSVSISY